MTARDEIVKRREEDPQSVPRHGRVPEGFISKAEALEILEISERYFKARKGAIQSVHINGKWAYYERDDIEKLKIKLDSEREMKNDPGSLRTAQVLEILGVSNSAFFAHERYGLNGTLVGNAMYYSRDEVERVRREIAEQRQSRKQELEARIPIKATSRAASRKKKTRRPPEMAPRKLQSDRPVYISGPNPFLEGLDEMVAEKTNSDHLKPPADHINEGELRDLARDSFYLLKPDELKVVELTLGLVSDVGASVEEVATELGMSPGTVIELHNAALQRLRLERMKRVSFI